MKNNMKKAMPFISIITAVLLVTGCSDKDSNGDEKIPPTQATGVIPAHQQRALQQAEQVDDTLKDAEQQRRENIEPQY